tara:strand:+ start:40 stop:492 length:453 start_codon:yes stop_codon:yes gene_type:complete
MGGSNDPSNIARITVEEHIEAHRKLYKEHGNWQDLAAINRLTNGGEPLFGEKNPMKQPEVIAKHKKAMRKAADAGTWSGSNNGFYGRKHTTATKKLLGEKNAIHQAGKSNSQYGTMWINNGVISKKMKNTEPLPEGWVKGRLSKNCNQYK